MKKLYILCFLSFFGVKVYGIHNLLINGSSSVTISTTDTFLITADFEQSGAVAKAILYYDINNNGILDTSDKWVAKFRFIDGNWADEDEMQNGVYSEKRAPLYMSGNFLLYAEDNGVSDTVAMQVLPAPSPYCIYGKVTEPANTPNLFVCIGDSLSLFGALSGLGDMGKYHCGDFTDSSGAYSISVPEKFSNDNFLIAVDILGITQNLIGQDSSIIISDTIQKDIAMQSITSDTDTTVLWGTVKNDLGNTVSEEVSLYVCVLGFGGKTGMVVSKTDANGAYRIRFSRFKNSGYYYFFMTDFGINKGFVDQFYPEYMSPCVFSKAGVNPSPSQINLKFKVYKTTNTISGNVYIQDSVSYEYVPLDNIQIDISTLDSSKCSGTYTKTYSDGHYTVYVSDSVSKYCVRITPEYIPPDGYKIIEGDTMIRIPGAINVDFHIGLDSIGVEEKPLSKSSFKAQPNPFTSEIVFEVSKEEYIEPMGIYNITGKKVCSLYPEGKNKVIRFIINDKEKRLPAGIYFYSLKAKNKTYKGKFIKLR